MKKILVDSDHVAEMIIAYLGLSHYSDDEEERMIVRKKISVAEDLLVLLDKFNVTTDS